MARVEARLRRKGGLKAGLIASGTSSAASAIMIPLLLFMLAIAAVYVGTIETAFSALMRLSLRLMAERGGRDDRLGFYLEDPIRLFLPARLLLGLIFSLATMFIAILTGRLRPASRSGCCCCSSRSSSSSCEHVLPLLIVRRNPERVLEVAAAAVRRRRARRCGR